MPPGLAATDAGADAILCCTRSGRTARAMARFRPAARLIGLSPDPATVRALALSWGVESLQVDDLHDHRRTGLVRRRVRGAARPGQLRRDGAGAGRCARPSERGSDRRAADRPRAREHVVGRGGRRRRTILSIVVIHGSMDRSAGMLKLSRRLDDGLPGAALRPSRLRPIDSARRPVHDGRTGRRSRRSARTGARRCWSATATAATSRSPRPTIILISLPASPSTRRRCRGSRGGRAPPPGAIAVADGRPTGGAAERFMRRMLGDRRWEELPERSSVTRRRRGRGDGGGTGRPAPASARGSRRTSRCRWSLRSGASASPITIRE